MSIISFIRRCLSSNSYKTLKTELDKQNAWERLSEAWCDANLPEKQSLLVDDELFDFRRGKIAGPFKALQACLEKCGLPTGNTTTLEVGCSSGYNSEVVESIFPNAEYTGCDTSPSFINLAREKYPQHKFYREDAVSLSYASKSFDIVISGCVILHIADYERAIDEAIRVSKKYIIFHRTPVLLKSSETWFLKKAYGVETLEIHFNEGEILNYIREKGARLIYEYSFKKSRRFSIKEQSVTKSYVFEV